MKPTGIDGAFICEPRVFPDQRGAFSEWFRAEEFRSELGYDFEVAQANWSVSRRGVIRGIHVTQVPPGQAKYVVCPSGAVLDVIVDLRVGSPTYLRWEAVPLDGESRRGVFLAEGLGHSFLALSPQATVMYLVSTPYAPGIEHGVNPLDPAIGIAWPREAEFVLSDKDAAAPSAAAAQEAGILPTYTACMDFAARREPGQRR
jgi:dTDP-4-dehydrorhamnose 3,5-epimerase